MISKRFLVIVLSTVFLLVILHFVKKDNDNKPAPSTNNLVQPTPVPTIVSDSISSTNVDIPRVEIWAQGLDTPWAIAFLPDGSMLVTERRGTVRLVDPSGKLQESPIAQIDSVKEIGEGGLMGIAIHPDFAGNARVYLYYTYGQNRSQTLNRVSYFSFINGKFEDENIIIDGIPGNSNHNGGRIKFGPDKYLYVTTGDAQEPSLAQNKDSLAGKILRVDGDGKSVPGNPFGNRVYSYGHRNPQGIIWDSNGGLWETEHGPSGFETGNDEFNKIEIGGNYGWPDIRGKQTKEGMLTPIFESGRGNTWAPSGLTYQSDEFYFTGLRGNALYSLDALGTSIETFLKGEYGRLREVVSGSDGMLYVATSNRDGRGIPKKGDDKILRVNPAKL